MFQDQGAETYTRHLAPHSANVTTSLFGLLVCLACWHHESRCRSAMYWTVHKLPKVLRQRWRALGCANSSQVEWNEVLTPCTASNTAPYLLGAGHSAAAALFYLVKYFTKDLVKINPALSVQGL